MTRARGEAFPRIFDLDTNRVGRPRKPDLDRLPEREADVTDAVGRGCSCHSDRRTVCSVAIAAYVGLFRIVLPFSLFLERRRSESRDAAAGHGAVM